MTQTIIVVGAGHAGGQAVATLRQKGFDGRIIMIGDEPYVPYERPPLSKAVLAGELEVERTFLKKDTWYPDKQIDFRANTQVTAIDRRAKTVTTSHGENLAYDKLLLATGTRVRKLQAPGAHLENIFYLRAIDDTLAIRKQMKPGAKVVIVGGGYIGLEVAAVAVKMGCDVTVLEGLDRVMSRVVAPEVSAFYDKVHTDAGVKIRTGMAVTGFEGHGKVERVTCADDSFFPADLVVIGVGVLPNVELAADGDLAVDNGIVVDEYCQTSDENVWAAGDCTNHPNALLGRRLRLESVQNAVDQAKTAANAMCGELKEYAEIPWFWSDQYDLKLQIVGLSEPGDEVVIRGNPAERKFSAIYLRHGKFVAINAINMIKDFMAAKKMIAAGTQLDPVRAADPEVPLKDL
ncbi:FAD-dependent oxidoreductase [Emcibacter sp. SYSU 3D8]|uniref:NAD(P)/FAD-dependent oxidoreductase n=1 Tax=Emcibacter sp. SYSU 3D8 TaxID=3133969 RepID=UPI0031FE661F